MKATHRRLLPNRLRPTRPSALVEPLEARIAPANFFVTNTNDSGAGSLREAIIQANTTSGADQILFNIPSAGALVIQPLTPLPTITEAVVIDGYSQPGTSPNSANIGTNALLRIELDGSLQTGGHGLVLAGTGGSTVRGLVVRDFGPGINDNGSGIVLRSNNNTITGNFLGTDVTGTQDRGNGNSGVSVGLFTGTATFTGNVIGGPGLGQRNLISGNSLGVSLTDDSFGTQVLNNLIGTNRSGDVALPNSNSGIVNRGNSTVIGAPSAGNVISGNTGWGINTGGTSTTIQGNIIGLNGEGSSPLGNGRSGVNFSNGATGGLVGGVSAGAGNIISGNDEEGIEIGSSFGDGPGNNIVVQGNRIGTDLLGGQAFGNGRSGIGVYGTSSATIGGVNPGEANVIAFNFGPGVQLEEVAGPITGVRISGNGIFSNAGLGINLAGGIEDFFGVTQNDPLDADTGPNDLANAPRLISFSNNGSSVTVTGTLEARPGRTYEIQIYASNPEQVNISGTGDGAVYLGSTAVMTDPSGITPILYSSLIGGLPGNTHFTALAIDQVSGETSEFSNAVGQSTIYTWTGAQSGDWFNGQNWLPIGVPGPLDTANYNGGINAIDLQALATVAVFNHSAGTLFGSGQLVILQDWSWTGGPHDGPELILNSPATANLNGSTPLVWDNGVLNFYGTGSVNGAGLNFNAGTFFVLPGGQLLLSSAGIIDTSAGPTVTAFNNAGTVVKLGSGSYGVQTNTVENIGLMEARQGQFQLGEYLQFDGELRLSGGSVTSATPLLFEGGLLTGTGAITGIVQQNGAIVQPGGPGAAGTINIFGDFLMGSDAILEIEIGGPVPGTQYDQIIVQAATALNNDLLVSFLGGFTPSGGQIFDFITAATRTGTFNTITGNGPLTVNYTPTGAQLTSSITTYVWDAGGGADTSWFNPLNWSPDGVPGVADSAVLNTAATITLTAPVTIARFMQTTGTVTGGGAMTITAEFDWRGGTMSGPSTLTIAPGAAAALNGPGTKTLDRRFLENQGTVSIVGTGNLAFQNGPTVTNTGTFDFQSDADFLALDTIGATWVNTGTLRKTAGTGISVIGDGGAFLTFNHSGVLEAGSGTLELRGLGGTFSAGGTLRPDTGATLAFAAGLYAFTGSPIINNPGTLLFSGATIDLAATALFDPAPQTQFVLSAGAITGAGSLNVNGSFTFSGGTMSGTGTTFVDSAGTLLFTGANPKLLDGRYLVNDGTVHVAGDVGLANGAQIDNTGLWNFQTDASLNAQDAAAKIFTNFPGAIVRKSAGGGSSVISAGLGSLAFGNFGLVESLDGRIVFQGGGGGTGGTFLAATGDLSFEGGAFTFGSATFGGGNRIFFLDPATLTFSGVVSVVDPGTELDVRTLFTANAALNTASATRLRLVSPGTLTGSGALNVSGELFFVSGTLAGTGPATILAGGNLTLPDSGGRTLDGRTLTLVGDGFWSGGNFTLAGGAVLNINANFEAATNDDFVAGAGGGAVNIAGGGIFTRSGGSGALVVPAGIAFNNSGEARTQFGQLQLGGGGGGTNGKFSANAGAEIVFSGGTHTLGGATTLDGSGNFTVTGGVVALANGTAINQTGTTLRIVGGALNLTGTTTVNAGGLFDLAGGTVGGTGTLSLAGGTLSGTGTFGANVANPGGFVRPGGTGTAGTLTIGGTYTQGAGGTLAVELGGTSAGQFDVLAVSGAATLAGTLNLAHLGGFTPTAGNSFRVVQAPANPGTFANLTGASAGKTQTADASGLVITQTGLTYVWDNTAGTGDWFNPLNWDLDNGVPGPGDIAILNIASTINLASNATVAAFQQSAGVLTGPGTLTTTSTLAWTGGSQTGTGTTNLPAGAELQISGAANKTIGGTRLFTLAGNTTLTGTGALVHDGTITNSGLFDIQGATNITGVGGTFNNTATGTLRKSGTGGAQIGQGATTLNNAGGVIEVLGGSLLATYGGTGNDGTYRAAPGTSLLLGNAVQTITLSGAPNFTGGGSILLNGPTLTLTGTAALTGAGTSFTLGNATLTINGTFTSDPGTTFFQSAGTLNGSGGFILDGTMTWTGGTIAGSGTRTLGTLDIGGTGSKTIDGANVSLRGPATWTGTGNLVLANGALLQAIFGSGGLEIQTDADVLHGGGATGTVFVGNFGLVRKAMSTGVTSFGTNINVTIASEGTLQAATGTLAFAGGFTQTGGRTELLGGALETSGTLAFQGGELRGGGTISGSVNNTGATVRPGGAGLPGTITITGDYTQTGGVLEVDIAGTGAGQFDVLDVGGLAALGGFNPIVGDSFPVLTAALRTGTFTTATSGLLNLTDTYTGTGAQLVRNAVTFTWDAGAAADTDWFNPLNWSPDGVPGPGDTAILGIAATATLGTDQTVATFQQSAGILDAAGTLTTTAGFAWSGGTQAGFGTTLVAIGATATISGAGSKILDAHRLDLRGNTTWTGVGNLVSLNGALIDNRAGALFEVQTDAGFTYGGNGAALVFNNAGTLRKSAGTGVTIFDGSFTNVGSLEANSGVLSFMGGTVNSSGTVVLNGGSLGGSFNLTAGELRGTGLINGSVTNAAAVRPGGTGAIGTLTITGNYTQLSGGTLALELGGIGTGQFDVLGVGGTASLGGTLAVSLIGGFTPAATDTFIVLSGGTLTGVFVPENLPPGFSATYGTTVLTLNAGAPPNPLEVNTPLDLVDANDAFTSLREAILFANSHAGLDTITFNIPGPGLQTITLLSALPAITDPVIIDGYTQPGTAMNTSATAFNGTLLIALDGAAAGAGATGLSIVAGGSTVRGLVISGFSGSGLNLNTTGGNQIEGNLIGTSATGGPGVGNGGNGVLVLNSTANTIGGATPAARNVISGNAIGILLGPGAGGNQVLGNFIGLDGSGTSATGNTGAGVRIVGSGNFVGGPGPGERNVLSGNSAGIELLGGFGNSVRGNLIGTDATGTAPLGNTGAGIFINLGGTHLIGGPNPGEGNVIAFNGAAGIAVALSRGNAILGNAIHANAGLGIDLDNDGASPNDGDDSDTGANDLFNFPVFDQVFTTPVGATAIGALTVAASGPVRIEFFLASAGQGRTFLGSTVVTGGAGATVPFVVNLTGSVNVGDFLVATASDLDPMGAGTSEFSAPVVAQPPAVISIADAIVVERDTGTRLLTFALTLDRAVPIPVTVNFATQDFTATAGQDYLAASGMVTFAANETVQTFTLTVLGDTRGEFRERFRVNFTAPVNADVPDAEAFGIIADDDHDLVAAGDGGGDSFSIHRLSPGGEQLVARIVPFTRGYQGGVRVAVGDVNGDGLDDFIAGAGLGGRGRVRVFDGATLEPMAGFFGDFNPFGSTYRGGVFVAAGDVNGDGHADVIVAPSAGSQNRVRVFDGASGVLLSDFRAFGKGSAGVRIAAGDVNGDGIDDIIAGSGRGSAVRVFDALAGTLLPGVDNAFRAFPKAYQGGVFVTAEDLDFDGRDEIIAGAASGASVRTFSAAGTVQEFTAFRGALRGVRLAALDVTGDGIAEIITAQGRKGSGKVQVLDGVNFTPLYDFSPFGKEKDGIYLG
jgi:hypothetical protein